MERYERSERSERYERAERSTGGSRGVAVRVPRRVVRNWERLVGAAVRADLEAGGEQSDWSSDEEGLDEDDDGFDRMVVPHSLAAQTDIDAVMEAAEDIQKDDSEVARILYEYAYYLTQQMDPLNRGRGVLQFKSSLKAVLMQKRLKHHIDRSQDVRLLTEYHTMLKEREDIEILDAEEQAAREGQVLDENPEYQDWRADKLRRFYEVAKILNNAANCLAAAQPEVASGGRNSAQTSSGGDSAPLLGSYQRRERRVGRFWALSLRMRVSLRMEAHYL